MGAAETALSADNRVKRQRLRRVGIVGGRGGGRDDDGVAEGDGTLVGLWMGWGGEAHGTPVGLVCVSGDADEATRRVEVAAW